MKIFISTIKNEVDNPENEVFVTEDNSDSESDPDKEPEVILRSSERETRKAHDPLRNINTNKGQSYTNIKKCVKTKKIKRNGETSSVQWRRI